ncbi:hypothetical protein BSKO_04778 [Bryopsis sp. KO-2023]|nr:hypothetical protein BSKO_04778 [Bryopsis sp. KO-2023]
MNTVVNASMEPEPISLLALVAWLPSILVATFPPCENLAGCQVVRLVFLVCNVQPSFDGCFLCRFLVVLNPESPLANKVSKSEQSEEAGGGPWRDNVVGVTTDGERKMTGRVKGVATRFEAVCKPGMFRIWCALHQLDISIQLACSRVMNERFYGLLTGLISYLRRQEKLIVEMKTKAKLVSDTRWESMAHVSAWFKLHRTRLLAHLDEKKPACAPPLSWWVVLMVVEKVTNLSVKTFRGLEGLATLLSQQRSELVILKSRLCDLVPTEGPLTGGRRVQLVNDDNYVLSSDKQFATNLVDVRGFVEDMGSFVLNIIQEVPEVEMNEIYRDYAWVHSSLVGGIAAIVAERDSDNRPDHSELPPVLPHQLVVLRGRDISAIVSGQRERLLTSWTLEDIDYIEQDHSDLLEEYKNDTVFKSAIDSHDERTSFKTAWSCVPSGKFTNLRRFVGGLATVFPTTSSVESDFSIVKWEKNVTRQSLTDFSLEGVLQSKQYARLEEMNI